MDHDNRNKNRAAVILAVVTALVLGSFLFSVRGGRQKRFLWTSSWRERALGKRRRKLRPRMPGLCPGPHRKDSA